MNSKLQDLQDEIAVMLHTVYDPEIPVNIFDLGLIYDVDVDEKKVSIFTTDILQRSCRYYQFIF